MGTAEEAYVVSHIEKAVEQGWIQVYYQPVIRSLTGDVCSAEALARWQDPERGMLSPGSFIPALEAAHRIDVLDRFVMECVARDLQRRMERGLPCVPVSFNLSRQDFSCFRPAEVLEEIADRHGVLHHFFRAEVTETALVDDEKRIIEAVKALRAKGFSVMLDDFGTGYSSLAVLTAYPIDELKLDRQFIRDFSERTQTVIRSIVLMAKTLGIHTLAEGVETREQLEFLQQIGCEKIQGYYYAPPMPFEKLLNHLSARRIRMEDFSEGQVYERAGLANLITETGAAIYSVCRGELRVLAANRAFVRLIGSSGEPALDEVMVYAEKIPATARRSLIALMMRAKDSGRVESFTFLEHGRYYHCLMRFLAGLDKLEVFYAELRDITREHDLSQEQAARTDLIADEFLRLYDDIYLLDWDSNCMEVVQTAMPNLRQGEQLRGILRSWSQIVSNAVYPEDREHAVSYLQQISREQENDTFVHNEGGFFRFRQTNGSYQWKTMVAIPFRRRGEQKSLLCLRDCLLAQVQSRAQFLTGFAASFGLSLQEDGQQMFSGSALWQSLVRFSPQAIFWKDRNHRYLGASDGFLAYFGLEDMNEISGRTVKELNWAFSAQKLEQEEDKLLETGQPVLEEIGHCLRGGREHAILYSKFPLYQKEKIVGVLGTFIDMEEWQNTQTRKLYSLIRDEVTDYYTLHGSLLVGAEFAENQMRFGEEYVLSMLGIPEFSRIVKAYGEKFRHQLLSLLQQKISPLLHRTTAASYLGAGRFLFFTKGEDAASVRGSLTRMAEHIHAITQVEGCAVTLSPVYAIARSTEAAGFDHLLLLLYRRFSETRRNLSEVFSGDYILLEMEKFDHSRACVFLTDQVTKKAVYMNASAREWLGFPRDFLYAGHTCYQLLGNERKLSCSHCPIENLPEDRSSWQHYHDEVTGRDFHICRMLVRWAKRRYCLTLLYPETLFHGEQTEVAGYLHQEMAIDDAISLALAEENPEKGILRLLEKIGRTLSADRLLVIEEKGDDRLSCTYEWHREAVPSMKHRLRDFPMATMQPLYEAFREDRIVTAERLADFEKQHPALRVQTADLRQFLAGKLTVGRHTYGYAVIQNPGPGKFQLAHVLIRSIMSVCAVLLRNRDMIGTLRDLSTVDQLTGVMNRRALIHGIERLSPQTSYAFVFGDINGLKRMNDTLGHEAGDRLIRTVASVFCDFIGSTNVFRMGGDEFLLVVKDADEAQTQTMLKEMRQSFAEKKVSVALGFVVQQAPVEDIDQIIHAADAHMYEDKRRFHAAECRKGGKEERP